MNAPKDIHMITKRFIQFTLSLFFIILLTALALALFVDPNRYKDKITQHLSDAIGKPVAIQGDLSWRFLPNLALSAQEVSIGEKGQDAFVTMGQVNVAVQIAPLLRRKINMDIDAKNVANNTFSEGMVTGTVLLDAATHHFDAEIAVNPAKINGKFTGLLVMNAELHGDKFALDALNGTVDFHIDNGVYHGVDFAYWLAEGQAILSTTNVDDLARIAVGAGVAVANLDKQRTEFTKMSATMTIENGIATNNDLVLYNPQLYTSGKGTVNYH
jgi:uncharacterized protein involved in outer membrane biogenesis